MFAFFARKPGDRRRKPGEETWGQTGRSPVYGKPGKSVTVEKRGTSRLSPHFRPRISCPRISPHFPRISEAEAADEGLAFFVEDEFEAHAFGVVHAADEAVVLLQLHEAGVVAVGLGWHGGILTCEASLACFYKASPSRSKKAARW